MIQFPKKQLLALAICAFSLACSAEKYHWNFSAGYWGNWEANFQKSDGAKGNPASSDDVVFDIANGGDAKNMPMLVVAEKTVCNLAIENLYQVDSTDKNKLHRRDFSISASLKDLETPHAQTSLKILGDFVFKIAPVSGNVKITPKDDPARADFYLSIGCEENLGHLKIGGEKCDNNATLFLGESKPRGNLSGLKIFGNAYFDGGQFSMNIGDGKSSLKNPDVDITGVVNFGGGGSWSVASKSSGTSACDTYISVGGLQTLRGAGKISNYCGDGVGGNTYLVLNSQKNSPHNYCGWLREYNKSRSLNIVMRGDGEQTIFENSRQPEKGFGEFMRGEITVKKGRLHLGSADATFKKINLDGGALSACSSASEVGALRVENFEWKRGVLLVDVDFAGDCDAVLIESDFLKKGKGGAKYKVEIISQSPLNCQQYMLAKWGGKTNFSARDFSVSKLDSALKATFEIRNGNELWVSFVRAEDETSAEIKSE